MQIIYLVLYGKDVLVFFPLKILSLILTMCSQVVAKVEAFVQLGKLEGVQVLVVPNSHMPLSLNDT